MEKITSAALAGGIVRRVREDQGVSRSKLAETTGVGSRTLYAFETGGSENFGLGNFLKVLNALGLSLSIELNENPAAAGNVAQRAELPPWDDLASVWKLDGEVRNGE